MKTASILPRRATSSFAFVAPAAGMLLLGGLACGDESTTDENPDDVLLAPPEAGKGVQFKMTTTVAPSSEGEQCLFFRAPAEGMNINRDELRFTAGSHHVLMYLTPYQDFPTKTEDGRDIDPSAPFDCSDGVTQLFKVNYLVGGSQNSTGGSIVSFPEGVAMKVPGNAVLVMNAHYINALTTPLEPEIRLNLHTIPDAEVKQEGGLLFWYNPFIKVDASGAGTATASCPVAQDITIRNGQSHMHRRGVGYEATLIPPGGAREQMYANDLWEGVPVKEWNDGLQVAAGSRIEWTCNYQNPEARTVYQGPRSTDEMCMWIASYWPANAQTGVCAADPTAVQETNFFNADWVGQGEKTCGSALTCLQAIDQTLGFYPFIHALTDCIMDTRPSSSEVVSDGIRCLLTHDNPTADCVPEIQACLADE